MRAMRKGLRGPDVERWQGFLIEQGLLDGRADGVFGDRTDAASRAFQQREGLVVDGIVGAKTLACAQALGLETYRRVRNEEVTPELTDQAKRLLKHHWHEPYGSEYPFEVGGRRYVGRIEQHYHPPGGPLRPWGYHPGVSLFVAVTLGPTEPVHDEASG
ncbi:MAG TPA: peptidoglycan-binding domain-containing protein [Polyangiaceae bacterium]|nr:peptidoglycan-binding domain-containing protein [Polyangiaceae bacterium]